ncbi:MAG: DUF2225 domain-containing protein [bacterium]|nr:DUF2225 domain-containing protein [bacterium]
MPSKIFIEKKVSCPACKTGFNLKYPNPKMYAATSRDADQRITDYSWTGGIKTDVLPHHYAVSQCPTCLLADFNESFETHEFEPKQKALYTIIVDTSRTQRTILRKLRQLVPKEDLDSESALALHLAALYSACLPGKPELLDNMKQGRLLLRLSWLYKEINPDAGSDTTQPAAPPKAGTTDALYSSLEDLEQKIEEFQELVSNIRELSKTRTLELKLEEAANPYSNAVAKLEEHMDMALETLPKLESIILQDKNSVLTLSDGHSPDDLGNADEKPQLKKVIIAMQALWPQLPGNEATSLSMAVEAFQQSTATESAEFSVLKNMGVSNLILTLLLKTGQLDRALLCCSNILKNGVRDKQSTQMAISQGKRDKSLKNTELKEMTRHIGVINTSLTKAQDIRKDIINKIYNRDKDKITAILKANAPAPVDQIHAALAEAGIQEDIINRLQEQQVIKEDNKKKKWFGS